MISVALADFHATLEIGKLYGDFCKTLSTHLFEWSRKGWWEERARSAGPAAAGSKTQIARRQPRQPSQDVHIQYE